MMRFTLALLLFPPIVICITKPKVAVVGGGWSGWSAAKTLCENGCDVTLLDAVPDPAGKKEMMSLNGKPIQPGERGFWYDYPNIAHLLKELNIDESSVFTEYTNSSFYSPEGLEATAPVFSSSEFPQLPSPLGQVFASFSKFKRLPLQDRASMAGLLYAILDLYRDESTFQSYDRMSAYDLFTMFGVSKRLIDDFLRPTLLVGLFKPPEELSAAVSMELLYYYALAHQTSFDVRWMKNGSVAGNFFKPLSNYLEKTYDLKILGGSRVTKLAFQGETAENSKITTSALTANKISSVYYTSASSSTAQCLDNLDGVILAVGTGGMRNILFGSPLLSSKSLQLSKAASLRSIDCISARLWLDKNVTTLSPVNVFAKFPSLRGAGGTFFMLNELQKENIDELWGVSKAVSINDNYISSNNSGDSSANTNSDNNNINIYNNVTNIAADAANNNSNNNNNNSNDNNISNNRGSVVAVDFYNAGALLPLSDEAIVNIIKNDLLEKVDEADFKMSRIVDSDVKRYPQAVSWFSPGSYDCRPRTVVDAADNLFVAGDWVVIQNNKNSYNNIQNKNQNNIERCKIKSNSEKCKNINEDLSFMTQEHGAKGLCQERAYVSGLVAANRLLEALAKDIPSYEPNQMATIIPIRADEIQVKLGTKINRKVMYALSKIFGGISPWLR